MPDRPVSATGAAGRRIFKPGDAPYAELCWIGRQERGEATYDLIPGARRQLDRYVTRIIAPNASVMTGPGTNTYLVGDRELAVIDPGPEDPAHVQAILAAGAGRIRWIVCSHTHLDHASAAGTIKKATGARIAAMPVANTAERAVPSGPWAEHHAKLVLDWPLADGDSIRLDGLSLRVICTPGHASNHLCLLLQETGMLFTGDHIMQGSTVVITPPDGNMRAYLQSLQRLQALEINVLAPGHGYLIGDPHLEVERLIRHRLAREDKARLALVQAGGSATLEALLPNVYDDVPLSLHSLAARSLRAHLEKLVEDGEVFYDAGRYSTVR
jgi:glyoxylase-like metal-dependent hydrolase (beta-lactamase superfamily II)